MAPSPLPVAREIKSSWKDKLPNPESRPTAFFPPLPATMSPADNSSRLLADKLPRTRCCALSPLSRLVGRVSVDATFVRGGKPRLLVLSLRISLPAFLNTFHSKFYRLTCCCDSTTKRIRRTLSPAAKLLLEINLFDDA